MKNQLKIAMVLVISVLLVGCEIAKPSAELINFMAKIYNVFFGFGYFIVLFGVLRILWGKKQEGILVLMMGAIFLSAAYIAFVAFTAFSPDFTIELVIPFI